MWKLSALALALALGFSSAYAEEMPRVLSAEELAQPRQQSHCAPLSDVTKVLAEHYHETPAVTMLTSEGVMLTIFASSDGATFTAFIVQPTGIACEFTSGTTFAVAPLPKTGPEA